jgi:metallo-beta-lactamase class B
VIVSHGHLDHAGGAKFLQERFGSRLIMTAADYDLMDQQNPVWKPKRDMVATDGYKLTLGDTTLTLHITPGHTEGTISTVIPVKDGRTSHIAAAWGGTLFNFGPIKPRLQAYAAPPSASRASRRPRRPTSSCPTTPSTTAARPSCRRCRRGRQASATPTWWARMRSPGI